MTVGARQQASGASYPPRQADYRGDDASRTHCPTERESDYAELTQVASRHARALLLLATVGVIGCAVATWWQVERSLNGNLLSHFYQFLWPLYGGYIVYLWRRLRRGANSLIGREEGPAPDPVRDDDDDEEVQAHNRYLAGKKADAQRRGL